MATSTSTSYSSVSSNLNMLGRVIRERSGYNIKDASVNYLFDYLKENNLEYKKFYINRITNPFDFAKTLQGRLSRGKGLSDTILWCSSQSHLTRYCNDWNKLCQIDFALDTAEINLVQTFDSTGVSYTINIWVPCYSYKFSDSVKDILDTYYKTDAESNQFSVIRRVRQQSHLILALSNLLGVPCGKLPMADTKAVIRFIEDNGLTYVNFKVSKLTDIGFVIYNNPSYCIVADGDSYNIGGNVYGLQYESSDKLNA